MKTRSSLFNTLSFLFLLLCMSCSTGKFWITETTCNNKTAPMGISLNDLKFSWKMESTERDVVQTAYQIVVFADGQKGEVWNSGKTESSGSILLPYKGPDLKPGTTYFWKVKVWDNHGHESDWSTTSRFVTGLFTAQDWSGAKWIGTSDLDSAGRIVPGIHVPGYRKEWRDQPSGNHLLPVLRKEFMVKKELQQALVFVSGMGHYELDLNGKKVGDRFISPGWTHYDSLCFYNIYDITNELIAGENAFGMWLGNGFYIIPNTLYRKLITAYGHPKMILKLQLTFKDGSEETIVSDESWKMIPGPITYSSIFAGETFNANLEPEGWNQAGSDDTGWQPAREVAAPSGKLASEEDYPVKVLEIIEVKGIRRTDSLETKYLYDFGQNASGIVELEVSGNKGDTVRLVPAELIDEKGMPLQDATGKPYYLTYILKGTGLEKWSPRFTYYGFRYVGVKGAVPDTVTESSTLPRIKRMTLLHTRNSAPETGSFTTSEELFNRINQLIKWAIKSNFQSVITDCPHREKLGWLEQTYLMGNSIHYNYNIYSLYKKQVSDMMAAQWSNGMIPTIAPEFVRFEGGFVDTPEWGSAGIILPWLICRWYGDAGVMREAWPMMTRYADYLKSKSDNHILDYGLGDWYDLGPNPPGYAQLTPVSLTATAIYFYDVKLMSEMALVLGKVAESKQYASWAEEIKTAFNKEFFDPETNTFSTGSQTAMAMPLVAGLVDNDKKQVVFKALVESVTCSGKALTAGDVGFHFLVRALSSGRAGELLYDMNARDDVPGYGYQLKKGATTLTESWAALERVSNNHLMLGHLMEWFYTGLAGIDQTDQSVAFKEIKIAPQMVEKIGEVGAAFDTPYGMISSHWKKNSTEYEIKVTIPVNTTAVVCLPLEEGKRLTESGKPVPESWITDKKPGEIVVSIGSGEYVFQQKQ